MSPKDGAYYKEFCRWVGFMQSSGRVIQGLMHQRPIGPEKPFLADQDYAVLRFLHERRSRCPELWSGNIKIWYEAFGQEAKGMLRSPRLMIGEGDPSDRKITNLCDHAEERKLWWISQRSYPEMIHHFYYFSPERRRWPPLNLNVYAISVERHMPIMKDKLS